ncbi:uncharacterized protein K452DRAFT_257120 [Aplosporella prunicola CBS 121167]|uniref:Rho-GAP domain-containing protein n=1 Tax=Aplosporella prunicola CBS 121167 TaxID=1176127 RepID=A0A6A6B4J8_9PEZI|nr:uncharacterized protein K452DRAFT_257120 [Aplosporella prunicola CBS 121167]KAF2138185.1 hypothetical protein K452DRAFT_257120 [Aplosporella prunicola CBS 121167]
MPSTAARNEGPFRDNTDNDNTSFYDYPPPSPQIENPFGDVAAIDDTASTHEVFGRRSTAAAEPRTVNGLPGKPEPAHEGGNATKNARPLSNHNRWSRASRQSQNSNGSDPSYTDSSRRRSKLAIQTLSKQFLTKLKPVRTNDSETGGQLSNDLAQSNGRVMGVPLGVSIQYAHVELDLEDGMGASLSDGRIPVVVGSCGEFLKKTEFYAFSLVDPKKNFLASNPLLEQLEQEFDSPDRGYGLQLKWEHQKNADHQASYILLRYLLTLPDTVIPSSSCPAFREAYLHHSGHSGSTKGQDFDTDGLFQAYYTLLDRLPQPNRNLLLYMLDLFAAAISRHGTTMLKKVVKIFRNTIIRSPRSLRSSNEKALNDAILIFLIRYQQKFVEKRRQSHRGRYSTQ